MKNSEIQASSLSAEANADPDMLDEYDFRGGRRGVYAERYAEGTNLVKLDPDVAAVFATPEAVNAVLRALIQTMPQANRAEATQ